ncbi:MAG: hypothetical protein IH991_24050 [Planctomycetes bacterium]|nr:hypothetical protein [Planctomycetota bacterium]
MAWFGSIGVACLVVVVAIIFLIGNHSDEVHKNSQGPSVGDSSPKENATPATKTDFQLSIWNDGADNLILELEHDSVQLERQAEQLWDDSASFPKSNNEEQPNSLPERETKP